MKKILSLILLFTLSVQAYAADADWRLHPIFDEEVSHVVETPDYVYFTSKHLVDNKTTSSLYSLFRYDKKGEELLSLSTMNLLNGNTVRDVIFNPAKGYLAVLYKDYNLDLLYNNGRVVNLPQYKQAQLNTSTDVYSMSVDPDHDRLYLATAFGYVAFNDKKNEVAESRNYNQPLKAFCRVGDMYLAINGNNLIGAAADFPRLSIDQYDLLGTFKNASELYPLNKNTVLIVGDLNPSRYIKKITVDESGIVDTEDIFNGYIYNIENTPNGLILTSGGEIYQIKADGTMSSLKRSDDYRDCAATTLNMTDIWNGKKRKGLSSVRKNGEKWNVTRNWMLPNAPSTFVSTSFANHPEFGFMMVNYGNMPTTSSFYNQSPFNLCSYIDGRWRNHGPTYTMPERASMMTDPNGIAIDPDNNNYVYIASYHNGFARLNLSNPQDVIHLSRESDPDFGNPGFVLLEPVPVLNPGYSNISPPFFDADGNLWMAFPDWDDPDEANPHFYCWLAADRKATTSATNIRKPKHVEFDIFFPATNLNVCIPLYRTGRGMMVYNSFDGTPHLAILNTNGTPTDPKDDKFYRFPNFTDTDGNAISLGRLKTLWEDPETGYVWIGYDEGACYFIPSQIINSNNYQLHRPKISRNDGTNLADYLLDGLCVNQITADGAGRKWFATSGGGVVCTSADGKEIINQFTTSNSPLPNDVVLGVAYNETNNSLMFSTEQGYAEFFLPSNQDSSDKTDIKAYPNPVRPEYSGYVTITDIPEGSFVKITDATGNLVKDLGVVKGFDIIWDISDSNFNRVKSGVYRIMVSPSGESSTYSGAGKILVIS